MHRSTHVLVLAAILTACGDSSSIDGETLYAMPQADGNTFACATCHALTEPADDNYIRPGHPIADAIRRPTFKNGTFTEMRDAVNICRVEWMAALPWAEDDANWIALRTFLESQAPSGPADPLVIQRVDPPVPPTGGDPDVGRQLFNGRCIVCHGMDGVGTQRAPRIAGLGLMPDYVTSRVRTSGATDSNAYTGLTGGRMPFWSADRVSDDELRDIAAYVEQSAAPDQTADAGVRPQADAAIRSCPSTHGNVGNVAQLSTLLHDVEGTATIVDDCTIRIDMFHYDGLGIVVEFYGAQDRDYPRGFSLSGELQRNQPYENVTLTVQLPENRTLDDMNSISVWCVSAGVNFGDGIFMPAN